MIHDSLSKIWKRLLSQLEHFVDNFVQNMLIIVTLMFRGATEEHLKKGFQFYMKDYVMFRKQSYTVIW